jgi:hypothetical protein
MMLFQMATEPACAELSQTIEVEKTVKTNSYEFI